MPFIFSGSCCQAEANRSIDKRQASHGALQMEVGATLSWPQTLLHPRELKRRREAEPASREQDGLLSMAGTQRCWLVYQTVRVGTWTGLLEAWFVSKNSTQAVNASIGDGTDVKNLARAVRSQYGTVYRLYVPQYACVERHRVARYDEHSTFRTPYR